jgi:hypothetical protein
MNTRLLITVAVSGMLGFLLAAQAQDEPAKAPASPGQLRDDSILQQQILQRRFAEFEQDLFKLIIKLKRSVKEEDRARADVLEKVLDRAKKELISVQFEVIVQQLKDQQLKSTGEIKIAAERSEKLADKLRELIALIREDPRQSKIRDEIARLKDLLKELDGIIQKQKVTQALTDANRTDKNELGKIQRKVTQQTQAFAKKLEGKDGKGDGKGNGKDGKGQAKEGKGGDKAAPGKDVGKQEPKSEIKPGEGTKVAKADPKSGEPKPGDKGGNKAGGEPKEASAKGGKGGEPSAKSGDSKSGSSQQSEAKGGKSGQGQGQGQSKQGGDDQSAQKGEQQPQQPSPQQDTPQTGKKQVKDVEEAIEKQHSAEENIDKGKNPDASKDEGEAISKLEDAKKKLEDLLRQLREEELERTLTDLIRRCEKMLAMQISVYNGTKGVDKQIADNSDKQPTRENKQDALKLSDQEGEIVVEASKAIEVLEAEGSAVAFPEVFQQVREDMLQVQRRLGVADVGEVTQTIEQDIIISLREMIEALKKAKQELENKKNNPPPPGQAPPPGDQKLLQLIQELKLIRSLQVRVNTRTQTYGRMYQAKEGEQTSDPRIRQELLNLSERQERIYGITNRLAKGDNQ